MVWIVWEVHYSFIFTILFMCSLMVEVDDGEDGIAVKIVDKDVVKVSVKMFFYETFLGNAKEKW